MPGGQERILRRRIKSVQSTKKITRAMELIAATRVVKAQQRAAAARPYARQITQVIENLAAAGTAVDHPLLRQRDEVRKVAFVAVTSDRGLAGAYNSAIIRATERELNGHREQGRDYSLILIGRKAEGYFRFRGYRIDHSFTGVSDTPRYEDARKIADVIADKFISGEIDQVELIYTEFVSMGSQRVAVRRFLPLSSTETMAEHSSGGHDAQSLTEFEPSPEAVLSALLPRYVEARLFGAMLEGAASEHASRQRAMKAATDNAEELRIKLTRQMNRARQDAITTEIMEIVGGAEALRAAGVAGIDVDIAALLAYAEIAAAPMHTERSAHAPDTTRARAVFGKKVTADDLALVEGIGPKIAEVLNAAGITTWRSLADTSVDRLRSILQGAGDRYRMHDPSTWPAQAALAAEGHFEQLKSLQDDLTAGRGGDGPNE